MITYVKLLDAAIVRKSRDLARQMPRALLRLASHQDSFQAFPPLIANSVPKSGTHLLKQILSVFPDASFWGTFWACQPSVSFKVRSKAKMVAAIQALVPGELVPAHLFYEPEFHAALRDKNAIHFFIYRDPRDLVISEAFYLTHMNRWHRLHKFFKNLGSDEERISFAILGDSYMRLPYYYPDVAERYSRYLGWLSTEKVCSVKFEELIHDHREAIIRHMVNFYIGETGKQIDADELVERAIRNINPFKSHTFREGKAGRWRELLTPTHKEQLKSVAGDLLIRLGYEKDLDWI